MRGSPLIAGLRELAPDKKAEALVPVPLAELKAGHNGVMRRDAESRVGGFHRVDLQRGQPVNGGKEFLADVVRFHRGQSVQGNVRPFQQPPNLREIREFGQSRCLIAGSGTKIPAKLGNFGDGTDSGLGR